MSTERESFDIRESCFSMARVSEFGATVEYDENSGVPPKKTGVISKQGHIIPTWKDRHFVLNSGVLMYYDDATHKGKKGQMHLKNVTILEDNNILRLSKPMAFGKKDQTTLELMIPNAVQRADWMAHIAAHIDFMNSLVW